MAKLTQANVEKIVDNAIKHDLENEKVVKEALIQSLKLAASEVGRFEPFNRLWKGVSNSTADGIRMFMANLVEHTGIEVTNEAGKTRKIGFFTYSRAKGFNHPDTKTDETKAHRKIIDEMSVEDLMKITLGRESRETIDRSMEATLEAFQDRIARAIKWGLQNGALTEAQAEPYNKLLDASKRVDPKVLEKEQQDKFDRFREQAEKRGFKLVAVENGSGKVENTSQTAKAA